MVLMPDTESPKRFIKGICAGIFPSGMPLAECFRQARNAGFDAVEISIGGEIRLDSPHEQLVRLSETAIKYRLSIATLWVSQPLSLSPLNSPDSSVRSRGVEAIRTAIAMATSLQCGTLLVVPGRVGAGARFEVPYETTWQRFTAELSKVIPAAENAKVILGIENVSNRFLVSPLEMRAFIDQFNSPWLRSHFDVGNVMYFGYPQDWILTLGPRIQRVHVKDRKAVPGSDSAAVGLLGGDVDWKSVMAALVKVGYRGFMSPEIANDPSDPGQLRKISEDLDKILALA
jgi:L-ribulose-5-phosphate 3-epimerase